MYLEKVGNFPRERHVRHDVIRFNLKNRASQSRKTDATDRSLAQQMATRFQGHRIPTRPNDLETDMVVMATRSLGKRKKESWGHTLRSA